MATEIKPVSPPEAAKLVEEGARYLDVRSEPEFAEGHAPGALNVPLLHQGPAGMLENADFLRIVEGALAKDERLVVGCKSGGRSRRAAGMLARAGYTAIFDVVGGFEGGRDAFGRAAPGWRAAGLPVETNQPAGQAYEDVKERAKR